MHILLVEPDQEVSSLIKDYLEDDESTSVRIAASSQQAINLSDKLKPDLVILELAIAGQNGFAFLHEFRSYGDWSEVPVIVHSSLVRDEKLIKIQLDELGVSKYLYKYTTELKTLKKIITEHLANHDTIAKRVFSETLR